ncbi:hypothetical protein [Nocardia sp. NPDC056100]|uniref:hypothetical protein n=1 Tax=Nocardia sp. NPDC056100 TaxID=3345712 RepID=UPI0035DED66D
MSAPHGALFQAAMWPAGSSTGTDQLDSSDLRGKRSIVARLPDVDLRQRGCDRQTKKNDRIDAMNFAGTFDGIDPLGKPIISTEWTSVPDPQERQRIQQFFDGGGMVMMTRRKSIDLMDPNRGRAVPMHFRTDGTWMWPQAIGYYLLEYGVPVQTSFLQHIRQCGYVARVPDMPEIKHAIELLNEAGRS